MLTLLGVLVVVVGFALRLNPLLVVLTAGLVTGIASGMDVVGVVAAIGKAFTSNRYMAVGWLVAAALGMTSLGGHPQMVRPLVAPMAEAAAERQLDQPLPPSLRFWLRAHAAAADNIGLFFGEDIFIAIGSILLMKGFLAQNGFDIEPLAFAVWAIPTAVLALLVHGARLFRLDQKLATLSSEEGRR